MLMKAGILVGELVVVAVGMVVVVVVGVIFFSEKRYLLLTEVECLGVGFGLVEGDIFDFGFVAAVVKMEVDNVELGRSCCYASQELFE